MSQKHLCPFCASPLLCHIRLGRIYWFCRHCHQEIPYGVFDDLDIGAKGENNLDKTLVSTGAFVNKKDFENLEQALQKVASAVKKEQEYQCLHSLDSKLEQLATLDELTQLANRYYFEEYLKQQWQRLETEREHISLIICALDSFKNFQEIYEKKEGDEYLQKLATIITLIVKRPRDLVARYEEAELVILLPYTEENGAIHVAKKIHSKIQFLNPHKQKIASIDLGISLGISSATPTSDFSPSVLVKTAQKALKEAKKEGGNQLFSLSL